MEIAAFWYVTLTDVSEEHAVFITNPQDEDCM
jgi:hypothetical protein